MSAIELTIPGEPCAQGRGRAFGFRRGDGSIGARVFDPQKSRSWKGAAAWLMRQAHAGKPLAGPLALHVEAVFTCPRSEWRKRSPLQRRHHAKRPDGDNVAKAICDAAKGVLWLDDAQIAKWEIEKWIGAQGEAPYVRLVVRPADEA